MSRGCGFGGVSRDDDAVARRGVELKREVKPARISIARVKDDVGRRLRVDEVNPEGRLPDRRQAR